MTHSEYERVKFALERALKQRSRRHVGLAILFCLAWAVMAAAFITSAVVGHWGDWAAFVSMFFLIWGWGIPVILAESVIKRPGSELNHSIDGLQETHRCKQPKVAGASGCEGRSPLPLPPGVAAGRPSGVGF
jgi:hypothetical protein